MKRIGRFFLLGCVAVGGSLFFGASLPFGVSWRWAALLTVSTGCSWLVLGALLIRFTKADMFDLADACLVTMAVGEIVLVTAGVFNIWGGSYATVGLEIGAVGLADTLMAITFISRLRPLGIPARMAILFWVLGLNGTWFVFLALFSKLILGGKN